MAETFAVEAKFDWKTNAPEVLSGLTKGFRELIGLTSELKKAFEGFDTGGLGQLTKGLKQLREFSMPSTALDSLKDVSSMMSNVAKSATEAAAAMTEMGKAVKAIPRIDTPGGGGGGGGNRSKDPTIGDAVQGGIGLYFGGQILGQAAGAALKPAYDLSKSRTVLLANNTPKQADAAIQAARDLQRSVAGTDVQGNIEVYRQLLALTQNPEEARALMPAFLPAGVALQTFNPDGGTYDKQLEGVTKSAEFKGMLSKIDPKTGKATIDPGAASHMADLLLDMNVVSKGAVAPDTFLKFLRSGGTAAANIDLSQIPYLIPVIQALGPEKAGTGLKGFAQQFSSGKMSEAAVDMLQEMGILSKDKKLYRKLGMGQFMLKPGALNEKMLEEAVFHPREFENEVLEPRVQAYNAKNYGKAYTAATADQKRVMDTATMQQFASRLPGGLYMSEILRNELLSDRDNAAYGKLDPEAVKQTMAQSPQVAVESFYGALKDLMGLLGGAPFKDAITVLNGFTATLNALSKAAEKHPAAAATASTAATDAAIGAGLMGGTAAIAKLLPKGIGTPLTMLGKASGTLFMIAAFDQIAAGILEGATSWLDKRIPWAATLDRKLAEAMHGLLGGSDSKSSVQKESFHGDGSTVLQPIKIVWELDGRQLAQKVTEHQIKLSRPGVLTGRNDPDYLSMPMPAGLRSA